MDVWSGETKVPEDLLPFISKFSDRFVQQPYTLNNADVVLIETSSPVEYSIDGFSVNRASISDGLLKPVKAIGKDIHRHLSKWHNHGLVGFDEEVRAAHSVEILKLLPDDLPDAHMVKRLVRDLRSKKADPRKGFSKILERISVPLGYMNHVWQFFPDGRFMNFPAGYHEGVDMVRADMGIPVYRPEDTVTKSGVSEVMREDFRHYSDDFVPVIASEMIDFAETLRLSSSAKLSSDSVKV
jgi:hypothetical protein